MDSYTSYYDLYYNDNTECYINPTDVYQGQDCQWLWAKNNKYDENEIDEDQVGKWMLFVSASYVNDVWNQIKEAVRTGYLWHSKVSATNLASETHAIMVYTKDFTDLPDVIEVLDYLESSGLKNPDIVIRYKTDQQTRAGLYSGGPQRPWIYASNTIRDMY